MNKGKLISIVLIVLVAFLSVGAVNHVFGSTTSECWPNFVVVSEAVIPEGDLTVNREVSAKLVLVEATPSLTGMTRLELQTELVNPVWNIIIDDEMPETYTRSKFNFVFDHAEYDTITIQLSGNAPSVGVKTEKVLIEAMQTAPPKATIHTITRYVTPTPEPILPGTHIAVSLNVPVTTNELLILGQYMEIRSYEYNLVYGILNTDLEKIETLDFVTWVSDEFTILP